MFTIYRSDVYQNPGNCLYPHKHVVIDEDSLREAVAKDYVCAGYRDSYRNNANFMGSDCLPVDCDNDHSEDPGDWKTPDDIMQAFPGVTFAVHYSRHHMREKDGKAARPRFHVLFPIASVDDAQAYADLKKLAYGVFPFFDRRALDAARFFFGTGDQKVTLYPGSMTLTEFLEENPFDDGMPEGQYGDAAIPQGRRNATMYMFAVRVLKRCGDCETSRNAFLERAAKCAPPLDEAELETIWRSAARFYGKVKNQSGYVPPEEYGKEAEYKPGDYSDVGQAEVLARFFCKELRYSPATHYIRYSDHHWMESEPGAQAVAHELTRRQMKDAAKMIAAAQKEMDDNGAQRLLDGLSKSKAEDCMDDAQRKSYHAFLAAQAYRAFVIKRRESKCIASALKEARPMLEISPSDLDADGFLLCTPEATYDLRRGMEGARKHSPDDYITKITSVSPGIKGRQIWEECLGVIFRGNAELIDYVQMICGLAVIGKVYVEALIIAYGEGSNGKSTFWNTVSRVLGSYSGNISADTLTMSCVRNTKPELAEAKGKRLLIASELREGARLNDSIVKQLCSTDEIFAEKKYKDPFSFKPCHTLVLYTNHLPRVGASDAGIWRRLIVIPFNAKITGSGDVKNYAEYLYDNAGESILAWIIEGARKVIAGNFKINVPRCVTEANESYREQNDWFAHFLEDMCVTDPSAQQPSGELYQAYRAYAQQCNEYVRSTTDFYAAIDKAGFLRSRRNGNRYIKGLRLKNDFEAMPDYLL